MMPSYRLPNRDQGFQRMIPRHLPILLAAALVPCLSGSGRADDFVFYHDNVLGTSMELKVAAKDVETARRSESAVLAEIDRLAAIYSGYDPSSEFSRWERAPRGQGPAPLSAELFGTLAAADRWRERSRGAFDARAEGLSRIWSRSARQGRIPDDAAIRQALDAMIDPAWRLDHESNTAERTSGAPITLNAIAKGEIVERSSRAGLIDGVHGLLLNVGGDLRVSGEQARTIAIVEPVAGSESTRPVARVRVQDRAVATSGPYHRGIAVGDRWYSHILDPRTGRPAEGIRGASVIAERSADADALATILNVVEPEEGIRLVEALPKAACRIEDAHGRVFASSRWADHELPAVEDDPPKADGAVSWGETHELLIRFEINQPDDSGRRYRRPYVAVWVENQEGFPVRNLAVWVSLGSAGPWRWLPDMKRWYKAESVRRKADKGDMVDAIGQATRAPGAYSLIWDGKDDKGKPLPSGVYTINLEAAREHGTYQFIRKEIELTTEPLKAELPGNIEIKSASLEIRPRESKDKAKARTEGSGSK